MRSQLHYYSRIQRQTKKRARRRGCYWTWLSKFLSIPDSYLVTPSDDHPRGHVHEWPFLPTLWGEPPNVEDHTTSATSVGLLEAEPTSHTSADVWGLKEAPWMDEKGGE